MPGAVIACSKIRRSIKESVRGKRRVRSAVCCSVPGSHGPLSPPPLFFSLPIVASRDSSNGKAVHTGIDSAMLAGLRLSQEAGSVSRDQEENQKIAAVVDEATKLPGALLVMGKGPQAVMEGWVQAKELQVYLKGDWLAVESGAWHCHLNVAEVEELRFVREPDVHDKERDAFSLRLLGKGSEPLLMVFFGMYDRGGELVPERVDGFNALKEKYGP